MYLGLDIGTSSVKALLFGGQGRLKAQATYPVGTCGGTEQPASAVAEAVLTAIQSIVQQLDGHAEQIKTIGLCGHGPSIVFINAQGQALSPIVTWQDHRATKEAQYLATHLPGFTKDGTSYEAKLLWFYRHHPHYFTVGCHALYPKDYLIYLLTGRCCTDGSTASAIAYYNREQACWDDSFVPSYVMPEVLPAWQAAGTTETAYAKSCGLAAGTLVILGGIDCFCEAIGAGGFGPEVAVDGTGTSTCLTRAVLPGLKGSAHVLPGYDLQVRMLSSTGSAFKWFSEKVAGQEIVGLATEVDPSTPQNLLFLPYLNGERSPVWDEKARGVFVGLTENTTRGQMLQALFQGVGCALRQNLQEMASHPEAGSTITAVHAVGGGNRNEAWLQIKADICGLPFYKMEENDASAFGAALLGAMGGGFYKKEDLPHLVKVQQIFTPNSACAQFYQNFYENYLLLYPALRSVFDGMYAF